MNAFAAALTALSLALTFATTATPATTATTAIAASAQPVGIAEARYDDPSRRDWADTGPRPLHGVIWYPAADGSAVRPWPLGPFEGGPNAPGAPLAAAPARWPLVVLSHGTGGSAATLDWLAEVLASHGYLVAAVNHHGNTAVEPAGYRLEGFVAAWERPRDLSVLVDRLLADPRFGPRIDRERIGVAGFSIGGYTALALAGARLDAARWRALCDHEQADAACALPPEIRDRWTPADVRRLLADDPRLHASAAHLGDPLRDARIRAAFAMAPVLGAQMDPASLAAIDIPLQLVVGSADDQAPADVTARPVATAAPHARLDVLPGVTHYAFLDRCTAAGRAALPALCIDPPGLDRDALHARVAADALAFFDRTLAPR